MEFRGFADLGFFPLQDHSSAQGGSSNAPLSARMMLAGGRIMSNPKPNQGNSTDDMLLVFGDDRSMGTLGDVHPWMFWQVRDREQRGMGMWNVMFPCVTIDADTRYGTAMVQPLWGGLFQNDIRFAGLQPEYAFGLPTFAKGQLGLVVPTTEEGQQRVNIYNLDQRLVAPNIAGDGQCGTMVVDLQPADTLCIDGAERVGSGGRHAQLQSLVRVVCAEPGQSLVRQGAATSGPGNILALNYYMSGVDGLPGFGAVFGQMQSGGQGWGPITPGGGSNSGVGTYTGPRRVADGSMYADGRPVMEPHSYEYEALGFRDDGEAVSGPESVDDLEHSNRYQRHAKNQQVQDRTGLSETTVSTDWWLTHAPSKASGGGSFGQGVDNVGTVGSGSKGLTGGGNPESVQQPLHTFGQFQPVLANSQGTAFMARNNGYGPISLGSTEDKHQHGTDRDGNPINAAHVHTEAYYYRNRRLDGPLYFEGEGYPFPGSLPLVSRVHLVYENSIQHNFAGLSRPGMWLWYAEVPDLAPKPGIPWDRPRVGTPPGVGGVGGRVGPGGPVAGGPGTPTGGGGGVGGRGGPGTGGPGGPKGPKGPTTGPRVGGGGGGGGGGRPGYVGITLERPPLPVRPVAWPVGGPVGGAGGGRVGDDPPDPGSPLPPADTGPRGPTTGPRNQPQVNAHNQRHESVPGSAFEVGDTSPANHGQYALFRPLMSGFSGVQFRPQLWVEGHPNFEANPQIHRNWIYADERRRPTTLTAHAWGGQSNAEAVFNHVQEPYASRARGGTGNGGVMFHPPRFEMEDYYGIRSVEDVSDTTSSAATTSYVLCAPGVSFALGLPNKDGTLKPNGSVISQDPTDPVSPFVVSHDGDEVVRAFSDSGEVMVELGRGGTTGIRLPVGTSAQRPSVPLAGHVRIVNDATTGEDELEWYDSQTATWRQAGGGGGIGTVTGVRLLGNSQATSGPVEEIEVDSPLLLQGGHLILKSLGVTDAYLDADSVTTAKIVDDGVTVAKVEPSLRNYTAYQVADLPAVTNSTLLTNLIGYSIPANTLGETGAAIARVQGYILNNTVSASAVNVAISWGGSFVFYDTWAIPKSTVYRGFELECRVQNCGATNKQWVSMKAVLSANTNALLGQGDLDSADVGGLVLGTNSGSFLTANTTAAQTIAVVMSWAAAAVNRTFKCQWGEVEVRRGS